MNSNNIPKISVLLPVFNSEKYLRESIDSVLSQNYKDFKLIIWDDGSTDNNASRKTAHYLWRWRTEKMFLFYSGYDILF